MFCFAGCLGLRKNAGLLCPLRPVTLNERTSTRTCLGPCPSVRRQVDRHGQASRYQVYCLTQQTRTFAWQRNEYSRHTELPSSRKLTAQIGKQRVGPAQRFVGLRSASPMAPHERSS
jgi:hypothetical protein